MYLGVDLGTTNVKAVVVGQQGEVAATGSVALERYCVADGGVEQDIEQLWDAASAAIGQAAGAAGGGAIRAVGVSSQGGAIQVLDGHDRPVGRLISWLDGRGRPFDLELTRELGGEFLAAHVGHGASGVTLGQVLRLRRVSPEMLRRPNRLGFAGDVIVGRLCGRRAHDPTSLSIAMLYNPWLGRADPEVLAKLGLEEGQLPDLLPVTSAAGALRSEVAGRLGLPAGIPVSPAVHDQYAAALGAGVVAPGQVNCGTGTAWVLLAITDRPLRPIAAEAFVCCHVVPGLYGQMLSLCNGGSAIQWVMNLLGREHATLAGIDDLIGRAPPGSAGLRFWPLLAAGDETAGPCRGGGRLTGITLAHQPCHLVRAAVEGLACELARRIGWLDAAGFAVRRISLCGAGAASRATPEIIAGVTGMPVACSRVADVSAFGAAMIARGLADGGTDLAGLARQWSATGRVVDPGPAAAVYRELRDQYLAPFAGARGGAA
jgi:sugar (pentulose or hexulose) kinase